MIPIDIIVKYCVAVNAPGDDMVKGTGGIDSESARHTAQLTLLNLYVNL